MGDLKRFIYGLVLKKAFTLMLIIFVPWLICVRLALGIFKHFICCYKIHTYIMLLCYMCGTECQYSTYCFDFKRPLQYVDILVIIFCLFNAKVITKTV